MKSTLEVPNSDFIDIPNMYNAPQQGESNTSDATYYLAETFNVAVITASWNPKITGALKDAALQSLSSHGVLPQNIHQYTVPGSFELSYAAQLWAKNPNIDAVICLGCVIQGETRHFDFICNAIANGITNVSLKYDKPVIFGVLTPNSQQQAEDRAGGKYGNKGEEAALTVLGMLSEEKKLKENI